MGYNVVSRAQLQLAVPPLAEMAKKGFIAAYEGPGGIYVVYSPPVAQGMQIGGSKPVHIATYVSQPTMVVQPGKKWEEGSANAVAQALAMQQVEARRDGTVLVVSTEDVARVLGGPATQTLDDMDSQAMSPPIAKLIGMRAMSAQGGAASVELASEDRHKGPTGSLHGGVVCDVADFAMSAACKTALGPDESFTMLELKVNFLSRIGIGTLRGDAKVKKRSPTMVLLECSVYDDTASLVAFATGTCVIQR
jgi:uncharacterized protein (TIGR00369 family)